MDLICIKFLYSREKTSIDNDNVQDILEVANYLTLVDVVDLSSSHILANLTADNTLAVLSLPDSLSLYKLCKAMLHLVFNHLQQIFPTCSALFIDGLNTIPDLLVNILIRRPGVSFRLAVNRVELEGNVCWKLVQTKCSIALRSLPRPRLFSKDSTGSALSPVRLARIWELQSSSMSTKARYRKNT